MTKGQTFKRGLAPYRQQVGDMGIIGVYAEEHTGHKDTITFEYRSVISGQKENITRHQTIKNKWEILEHIDEAIFYTPFMIQSHA